jgi:HD-GYP domain-containing protein (c-di-GMP phosphodiesterase class II)
LRLGESALLVDYPLDERKTWQEFYDRAFWGEKFNIEREVRLPGKTAWLDFHFNPIRSESGQVAGVAVIERDITQAKLAAIELARAYDTTLEGWSRALDLRDRETEGHARRVTELTVCLAREFGIPEPELTHIRRGALLHDIGKMGVPDQILRKPDKLNEEEWKIMSRHPDLALGMLAPISFLRPALDIPYCHHEKWDGSGYPRGLKGEEIPLSARIFAIVDVWDALISDRPYSAAWSGSDALQYICSQSGKHFDPDVVAVFERFLRISKSL